MLFVMQVGVIKRVKAVFIMLLTELCAKLATIREAAVRRALIVGSDDAPTPIFPAV